MLNISRYKISLILIMVILSTCNKININKQCCDDSTLENYIPNNDIEIIAPNIITPNNDSKNEVFYYWVRNKDLNNQSIPSFLNIVFKVYTEDKKLVYESNDYQNNFSGNDIDGKRLPQGRYRYELYLNNNFVKGKLCIIRSKNICTDQCRSIDENDQLLLNSSCN